MSFNDLCFVKLQEKTEKHNNNLTKLWLAAIDRHGSVGFIILVSVSNIFHFFLSILMSLN